MDTAPERLRIAVVGAGIIGACAAHELVRRGHEVTLVEAAVPGGEQAASFGNGAFISPASIIPMAMPGLWRQVPGYLSDPTGPLTIAPASLPRLLPWLCRFLWANATMPRARRTVAALHALLQDGPARHAALAAEIGAPGLIRRDGLLYAYPDRAAFAAEARSWSLRRDHGLVWRELEGEALRTAEPALSPRYGFGILLESGAHCTDPGAYVAAIVARACAAGAVLRRARATGFDMSGGRLGALLTDAGPLPCDRAVIATGIGGAALARRAGDRVPLEAERGYHLAIPGAGVTLRRPVMPSDGRMANTMTAGCLRAAGQVELSRADAAPNWARAEVLLGHLRDTYPGLEIPAEGLQRWQGNRPSTPDGLPVIGPARAAGVFHAFGHGHVGLNAGPATAALLADLIGGRPPAIDPDPYAVGRFRWRGR
ncbi:NAD(P)/FAD-dependent oxidoreductase [Frigidibacter sp. MR17.24]|uniref:NAD(P)/FAD-dependent oxidoreductase n=1 Tax=Frigidibacter sp. MR17.24 TaxID=3127345 RepID=UPI003012AF6C